MKNKNTKMLVFGGLMVALTAVLMLACRYMPVLSVLGTFICGVPMAVFAAASGFKLLIPATIAVFALSVLIDGNLISAASMVFMSVVPGIAAGFMLGRKKSFFAGLFVTCLAVCVGWIFELLVLETFLDSGFDEIIGEVLSQVKTILNTLVGSLDKSTTESLKVSPEQLVGLAMEMVEFSTRLYLPSVVILSSMVSGYIIIRISGFVISRAHICDVKILPFSHLRAPRNMSVVAIIFYIIYIFLNQNSGLWPVFANLVLILYAIIGTCGLSVIDFNLKAKINSGLLRFLIYAGVFFFGSTLMSIISTILILIGIMDASRDFRRIGTIDKDA